MGEEVRMGFVEGERVVGVNEEELRDGEVEGVWWEVVEGGG